MSAWGAFPSPPDADVSIAYRVAHAVLKSLSPPKVQPYREPLLRPDDGVGVLVVASFLLSKVALAVPLLPSQSEVEEFGCVDAPRKEE